MNIHLGVEPSKHHLATAQLSLQQNDYHDICLR